MKRRCRPILVKSASILLGGLCLLFFACGESKLGVSTPALGRDLPDETSRDVTITEFNGTKVDYILKAGKIERFYDRRILNAFKVDITAYDAKTGDISKIRADSTIVDDARNIIFANGNVQLDSPGGSITCSKLVWDRNMDLLTVPGKVTLVRDGNVLRGENLRTNSHIDNAEMDKVSAEGIFGEEYLDW